MLRENLLNEPTGVFAASLLELLGYMAVCRGAADEALDCARRARRHLGDSREPQFSHALAYLEAEAARLRGDLPAASAAAAAGLTESSAWYSPRYAWPLVWLGARIDADSATMARDRGLPPPPPATSSEHLPAPSPAARAYRCTTAAEAERRDGRPAGAAWQDAVRAWEDAGDAWPLAYARFRLAEALCGEGLRDEAREPLAAAARSAETMRAQPLLADVLALARRARLTLDDDAAPAPEPQDTAPFGLTDRELEVLALIAAGRSNGEIATSLFISRKTASVHVSNILGKLGVAGRVEAAGVAHRLGLVQPQA
jgi:ATP/maltotriose-dependent transcriptional regulator MalT